MESPKPSNLGTCMMPTIWLEEPVGAARWRNLTVAGSGERRQDALFQGSGLNPKP